MTSWIDSELEGSKFKDERLGKRFLKIVKSLSEKLGESVPIACQDWANTKADYRFFSNPNLSEDEILKGHFQSTKARFDETEGLI
ncbi:transposase [bacterium]|jgi:Transposase DNA-binding|nr:transposase [bacterium]